jgi:hypothetical protein
MSKYFIKKVCSNFVADDVGYGIRGGRNTPDCDDTILAVFC